jgi:hypothetical protein
LFRVEGDALGCECRAERVCVEAVEAVVGDEADVAEDEAAVVGPDDAGSWEVEGELLTGVDGEAGGQIDVNGCGSVGGECVAGA